MIVVGGGATGAGVAVDAATRGYATLLLEQHDFGKGTSSRSTKLVHGGVRYLEQGNVSLVMEALKERGLLRQNAPHLVSELACVVPSYAWWEGPFYGIGLKVYELLAGKYGFGKSHTISKEETLLRLPNINPEGLTGGVVYYDGQFDDTRLLINLIATAAEQGATLLNYAKVTALNKGSDGIVNGVTWQNVETGETYQRTGKSGHQCHRHIHRFRAPARRTRRQSNDRAQPGCPSGIRSLIFAGHKCHFGAAHQGRPRYVRHSLAWPHLGWHHRHADEGNSLEPVALDEEIDFMLETAGLYLEKKPSRSDILSVYAGIRPLAKSGESGNTAALSRDHTIHIDKSGLLSITGGKWTTYRNMAQGCVDQAATLANLPDKPCLTPNLNIHGYHPNAGNFGSLSFYGSDAPAIHQLISDDPKLGAQLDSDLPYVEAEVVWAARTEMARTVEDVLARRTRALFLNAKAAIRMAPRVAAILAIELNKDGLWQADQIKSFSQTAQRLFGPS